MEVLTLQGARVAVEEYLRRFDGDVRRVRRRALDDGRWWARAVVESGDPGRTLRTMIDDGVDRGLRITKFADLGLLMTVFEVPHRPRPEAEQEAEWRHDALAAIRHALDAAGVQIIYMCDTTRMPIDLTGPSELGSAVGFVALAANVPMRLEAVGIVRDDDHGTLRIEPRTDPWEGPWMDL